MNHQTEINADMGWFEIIKHVFASIANSIYKASLTVDDVVGTVHNLAKTSNEVSGNYSKIAIYDSQCAYKDKINERNEALREAGLDPEDFMDTEDPSEFA